MFDVDQSAFATGLAALTINGTLTASTTPGNYYLKMAGNLTAAQAGGQLNAGSVGTAYPINCTFTIFLNGNYSIDGGASNYLTLNLYCYDPPVRYAQLISGTAKAITSVSVGATTTIGCTGHGYAAGAVVYLANVSGIPYLSNRFFYVKTVATNSFTISWQDATAVDVDSTGWGSYTSGGLVCPQTAEAVSATQIELDSDVSADPEWTRAGALVRIDNVNRGVQSEQYAVAALATGYITLASGLTNAKLAGSKTILVSRNITITCSATTVTNGLIYRGAGHMLRCALRAGNTQTPGCNGSSYTTMAGVISGGQHGFVNGAVNVVSGIISAAAYAINGGNTFTVSGTISGSIAAFGYASGIISGLVSGCGTSVTYAYNVNVTGTIFGCGTGISATPKVSILGEIISCGSAFANGVNALIGGRISGCATALSLSTCRCAGQAKFVGNGSDVSMSELYGSGSQFLYSAMPVFQVVNFIYSLTATGREQVLIRDYAGTPGSLRAWMYAGTITDRSGAEPNFPVGYTYKLSPVVNTRPIHLSWPIWCEAGSFITANCYGQKDGNAWTETPRWQLFHETNDPFDGGTPDLEQVMADNTSQQQNVLTFKATRTGIHYLRVRGINATGNLWVAATVSAGQAGPVIGSRILHGLGAI